MTDKEAETLKKRLETALGTYSSVKGVLFGTVAYDVFLMKGWIVMKPQVGIDPPFLEFEAPFFGDILAHRLESIPDDYAQIV